MKGIVEIMPSSVPCSDLWAWEFQLGLSFWWVVQIARVGFWSIIVGINVRS